MNTNNPTSDDLIAKYLCGEASPEEAIELEEWKASSHQNQKYFDAMEMAFLIVSEQDKSTPQKERAWQTFRLRLYRNKKYRWLFGLAAALVFGVTALLFLMKRQEMPLEILAINDAVYKTLDDKSEIKLEKNSHITFTKGYGKTNRNLTLRGKAEFTVTQNAELPFTIVSDGVFIQDIGTIFTVDARPQSDTVYVVVNEGIVRLYDDLGSEIIIKGGEKAWYIRSQKKIITEFDTKIVKFDFKDTQLVDAVDLLEHTYDINILLRPESIGKCRITTQFFDEEIATIITVITETLGFNYQYQDHHYIIEGKPCH